MENITVVNYEHFLVNHFNEYYKYSLTNFIQTFRRTEDFIKLRHMKSKLMKVHDHDEVFLITNHDESYLSADGKHMMNVVEYIYHRLDALDYRKLAIRQLTQGIHGSDYIIRDHMKVYITYDVEQLMADMTYPDFKFR